jgi:polyisoprenyl-phosphate glycosyltransferase
MSLLLPSLTVVIVVNRTVASSDSLAQLANVLEQQVANFDLVLVANGVDTDTGLRLKELVLSEPDTTVVFLSETVHDDLARLVGIEHAVGDHVLFFDPGEHDASMVPAILAPLRDGYDVVAGVIPELLVERRPLSRLLFETYLLMYRRMTGIEMERHPSGLRALSRAAALFVAGRPNGELLLRSRNIGSGFPATSVTVPLAKPFVRHAWTEGKDWSRGLSLLLSVSTVPLRGASHIAMLGGVISMLYATYVLAIFLFKENVAAGWTTISLQLAALMFIFSLLFLFLTEYIIQIHAANPPRSRRYLVLRELRSTLSRRSLRLNIVDMDGRFQLGAPPELLAKADPGQT